ncbi:MAG: DNA repair protein RadC [SAR324 cluster bacterium]|uniref:DNA repair protein RadC n=1 Tax=SAR324 cluster bacterium TaxID=2024889 RepID=A0A7X9IKU2_9DELT|nr:DNA repair protein RadC [SAR324 cluster bacterium]
MKKISELANEDRPRERLISRGARFLSDKELLAVLLGSGNKEDNVLALAAKTLAIVDEKNGNLAVENLLELRGVGEAKACVICAALEFARRRIIPEGLRIKEPKDALPLFQHFLERKQETFVCVSLSGANEVIACRVVTVGLANSCQVHPREVLADPLVDRACSILVAHNHPSGDLIPSEEDRRITERLREAAKVVGINFLDHIIFSKRGYYSFLEGRAITL